MGQHNKHIPEKHIIVCGYTGFNNFGDELLIATLVQQLAQVSKAASQPLTLTILSANPAQTRQWVAPYQGHLTIRTAHRFNLLALLPLLLQADGLIVGGGGLFQDVSGLGSPVYYGGLTALARLLRCHVAYWGQGIGPLHTALGQWLTTRALKLANPIGVRDAASAHWVRRHVGRAPAPSTDAVWGFQHHAAPQPQPALQTHKPNGAFVVGLSLRPTPTWPPDTLNAFLAILTQQLAPHPAVVVKLLNAHPQLDITPLTHAGDTLQHQHPNLKVEWVDCAEIPQALTTCQQVVAMRFHVLMAAATAAIPTIGLVYDPKVADLCHKVDLPAIHPGQLPSPKDFSTHQWQHRANPTAIQQQQQLSLKNTDLLVAFIAKLP